MIVTLLPRPAKMEANSQPMAPPPTTTRLAGTSSRRRISSLVITRGSEKSKTGRRIGSEPEARMTASPSSRLPSSRATLRAPARRP